MPNYHGKSPLRMQCPGCGTIGEHPVVRTLRSDFAYSSRKFPVLQSAIGSDLLYRIRNKHCDSCGIDFRTVELSEGDLWYIVKEASRLYDAYGKSERLVAQLRDAINSAAGTLKPVTTKPARRRRTSA